MCECALGLGQPVSQLNNYLPTTDNETLEHIDDQPELTFWTASQALPEKLQNKLTSI